jgi:hypothetical protein
MLERREKDKEEIDLELCFSELKQKAGVRQEMQILDLASQSERDLREMQDMQGLYR